MTIRSVAKRAGVSVMTVSNVINHRGKASSATVEMVNRVIEELGYRPNLAARQLVGTRGTAIGLLYSDRETPFLDAVLIGALKATTSRGLQLLVRDGAGRSKGEALRLAKKLVESGAEALVLIPPFAELLSGTSGFKTLGVPAAAIATGKGLPDMSTIRIDNRAAMRRMTELVLARGHRLVRFITGPSGHGDVAERLRGFQDALEAYGVPYAERLAVQGRFTFDSGVEAARQLLDESPGITAIIASNDDMAAGVVAEAQRRHIRMPEDLVVTGFDDTRIATRIWPPLTVVRQPIGAMAHRATELLIMELTSGEAGFQPVDEVIDYELIERESTSRSS